MAKTENTQDGAVSMMDFLPDAAELLGVGSTNVAVTTEGPANDAGGDPASEDPAKHGDGSDDENNDRVEEETDQQDPSDSDEEGDKSAEKVQKRIDKLTARAKSAEEQAEARRLELDQLRAELEKRSEPVKEPVLAPSIQNPLADVSDMKSLNDRLANAFTVKRWCTENPDGGTVRNAKGEEVDIDTAAARKMLADAEEMILVHGPRREKFLAEHESHTAVAREVYPELFERGTEMQKQFSNLIAAWPEVMRFPDYHLVLGDYMTGLKARSGKAAEASAVAGKSVAAAVAPKAKPTIAPPVPKPASKPNIKPNKAVSVDQVIQKGGGVDALAEFFAA